MNLVIIGAAGLGKRLKKNKPKALIKLVDWPIFIHSLLAFNFSLIDGIVLVVPKKFKTDFTRALKKFAPVNLQKKVIALVVGGKERQDSVFLALEYLRSHDFSDQDLVLVHNAANLFIKRKEIKALLENLKKPSVRGVALAIPTCDTLREVDSSLRPVKTLDREKIWRMQTPQGARMGDLYSAFKKAKNDRYYGTDELELLIRAGLATKIIPANNLNFKITYSEDLRLAEAIIRAGVFSYC